VTRLVCCLALCGGIGTAHAGPVTYTLDPGASQLTVQIFKDTSALSDFAHDHVILATGWTGRTIIDLDENGKVRSCHIKVDVPISGLQVDNPALRQVLGMKVMLTDAQRAQVGEHMRGEDQLNAASYSTISFAAWACSGSLGAMQVEGSMSIRGTYKAVSFTFPASITDGTLTGSGGFSLTHSDFGFSPYTAFLGQLRNKEELRFSLKVTGTAQ